MITSLLKATKTLSKSLSTTSTVTGAKRSYKKVRVLKSGKNKGKVKNFTSKNRKSFLAAKRSAKEQTKKLRKRHFNSFQKKFSKGKPTLSAAKKKWKDMYVAEVWNYAYSNPDKLSSEEAFKLTGTLGENVKKENLIKYAQERKII